ncbi:hypothetical protein M422DRAFT_45432 [Sphaerobolus stellatus SS14]|nr:hypothetical protein M422DRAFT_45432 [Sphaerobolus stellatus SS14]
MPPTNRLAYHSVTVFCQASSTGSPPMPGPIAGSSNQSHSLQSPSPAHTIPTRGMPPLPQIIQSFSQQLSAARGPLPYEVARQASMSTAREDTDADQREGFGGAKRMKKKTPLSPYEGSPYHTRNKARVSTTLKKGKGKATTAVPPQRSYILCLLPVLGTTKPGSFSFELSYISNIVLQRYTAELCWLLDFADEDPLEQPLHSKLKRISIQPDGQHAWRPIDTMVRTRLACNAVGLPGVSHEPPKSLSVLIGTPQTLAWHLLRPENTLQKPGVGGAKCAHRNYNRIQASEGEVFSGDDMCTKFSKDKIFISELGQFNVVFAAPRFNDLFGTVTSFFPASGLTGPHRCFGDRLLPFTLGIDFDNEDPWAEFKEDDDECYDDCIIPPWGPQPDPISLASTPSHDLSGDGPEPSLRPTPTPSPHANPLRTNTPISILDTPCNLALPVVASSLTLAPSLIALSSTSIGNGTHFHHPSSRVHQYSPSSQARCSPGIPVIDYTLASDFHLSSLLWLKTWRYLFLLMP